MPETAEQIELSCVDRQPMRGHKVKQANQLTVARYLLGEQSQKLLLYAISMIDREAKQFARYRIEIASYAAACGISGHALHEQLWDAAKEIASKPLIILNHREPDGKLVDLITHWFAEVKRAPGYIEVTFPPSLAGYLVDVQQRFFLYELGIPLQFRGEYAIRLYQFCKSWQFRGSKEISFPDLRGVLGLVEWDGAGKVVKERLNSFGETKKWALLPAVEQINQSSDISVGMREVKKPGSKRVESVVFTIVPNPKYVPDPTVPRLPGVRLAASSDPATVAMRETLLTEFRLDKEKTRQALAKYPLAYIAEKAAIVRGSKTDNMARLLMAALKADYQPAKANKPGKAAKKAAPAPAPVVISEPSPADAEVLARFEAERARRKAKKTGEAQPASVPAAAAAGSGGDELPF